MHPQTLAKLSEPRLIALFQELAVGPPLQRPRYNQGVLEALGLVVVRFQRLEDSLRDLFLALSGSDPSVALRIVLPELRFKSLLLSIGATLQYRSFPRPDDLRHVLAAAGQAEEVRNALLHSVWSTGPRMKEKADMKKGLLLHLESYTGPELSRIAEWIARIDCLVEHFHSLLAQAHASGLSGESGA